MKKVKRFLVLIVGIFFILLGFIGLFLPIIQGVLFIFVGFFLLSFYFPKTKVLIEKYTKKYPHLYLVTKKVEGWISKIIGEI